MPFIGRNGLEFHTSVFRDDYFEILGLLFLIFYKYEMVHGEWDSNPSIMLSESYVLMHESMNYSLELNLFDLWYRSLFNSPVQRIQI